MTHQMGNRLPYLVLVAGMVVTFAWTQRDANDARARDRRQTDARVLATCESGNDFRAQDLRTWTYLVGLSPKPTSAAAQKRIDDFLTFTRQKDAPRDCKAPTKGTP